MKLAILSGAIKNAGDYLIVERSKELIKNIFPECELYQFYRNKSIRPYLSKINSCDGLILAGGPAYLPNAYPDVIPLVDNLDDIKVKIYTLGLGWYGQYSNNDTVYNYVFNQKMRQLMDRIHKDSGYFSCRDWISVNVLHNNGYMNTIMTGCPAWYRKEFIHWTELRTSICLPFRKICISDPANEKNIGQALLLIKYIRKKFTDAHIIFVFHRNKSSKLISELKKLKIEIADISSKSEGFKIYDDCDLHIGFRVHAHIYNLSSRNISVLIEEDGRGGGVNQALKLNHITSYCEVGDFLPKLYNKTLAISDKFDISTEIYLNRYLIKNIDNYLNQLHENNYVEMKYAYLEMTRYYKNMEKHIDTFGP